MLVQPSTDYVFDGRASQPYPEDSATAPRTAYGRTKLAGEHAVLDQPGLAGYVVRTAWLYGAFGKSFVGTMIGRARAQADVQVVDDQRGQPTWTVDVAGQIARAGRRGRGARHLPRDQLGRYHLVRAGPGGVPAARRGPGPGPAGAQRRLRPAAAPRPAYSVLGHAAWAEAGLPPIGDWRDGAAAGRCPSLAAARV